MLLFWIYFALYILLLLFVWGSFLIAKIHVYKFKEYSTHIVPVTRFVWVFLSLLTVIGLYIVLQTLSGSSVPNTPPGWATNQVEQY